MRSIVQVNSGVAEMQTLLSCCLLNDPMKEIVQAINHPIQDFDITPA